jgi:hypothetical protein
MEGFLPCGNGKEISYILQPAILSYEVETFQ